MSLYGKASHALGQLKQMGARLPDVNRFLRAYLIKEALLSSAIAGIHTTLVDAFSSKFNKNGLHKDTQLVLNYTKSSPIAVGMLQEEGFPLGSCIILKAHEALLAETHEDHKTPGNYRRQSVKVGDLVPPPAPEVLTMIGDLEKVY